MHQNVLDQEVGISRTLMAASAWKGINVPCTVLSSLSEAMVAHHGAVRHLLHRTQNCNQSMS